ncbi:transcription factor domain-containing protein [Aspergillus undulatus]|uniref:transcription factor domain-containing protein n=1 Tax=Aspergillus undulatus TaxID=1810928 RepID=UPI003CCCF28E
MLPAGIYKPNRGPKRRRVNVACSPCRAHKIRCDGIRPNCGTCQRRREECAYPDDSTGRIPETFGRGEDNGPNEANLQLAPDLQLSMPAEVPLEQEVTAMGLAARPLSNNDRVEKGFFGDSSAVAFIKRLQETLKSGEPAPELVKQPQNATGYGTTQRTPPGGSTQGITIPLDLLPPRALADHLVDCYIAKIHTLYPFVHKEAFLSLYHAIWMSGNSGSNIFNNSGIGLGDPAVTVTTFYYGLNMVFATGCLFSDLLGTERETTSEAFFYRCKPALDVDYLERGDLALVQVLMLMSHYLQGSQTPNRCWHVIGTACRMAQAIGLHSITGDERRSFAQKQIRRRVWHGCMMLDLAASTMLGRPAMTSHPQSVPLPEAIDDYYLSPDFVICLQPPNTPSRVEWFVATLKLHELLRRMSKLTNHVTTEAYSGRYPDQEMAHDIQQVQYVTQIDLELENCRANIPKPLNWESIEDNEQDPMLREKYLLKARFLYVRILAYRPVLSQSLDHVRVKTNDANRILEKPETGIYSNLTMNCSVLCVQSAIDLISLVNETCRTELASVWFYNVFYTFSAGLVIILAKFHGRALEIVTRRALDLAWDQCQSTLHYLKSYSGVAGRCAHSLDDIRSRCLRMHSGKKLYHVHLCSSADRLRPKWPEPESTTD